MDYLKEYSALAPQERRQLAYKRAYKRRVPAWDDSMIRLRDEVASRLDPGVVVLDLGCGRGNFVLDELKDRIGKTIGLDASAEATQGNATCQEIAYGDAGTLPFADASFNAVVSQWVLEHLADPAKAFAEVARVLKPGGFFAFVTPNRDSLLIRLRRLLSKRTADHLLERLYGRAEKDVFDVHYRANSLPDLRRLISEAGLDPELLVENEDPSYTSFDPITYALSRAFSALPFSISKPHLIGLANKPK